MTDGDGCVGYRARKDSGLCTGGIWSGRQECSERDCEIWLRNKRLPAGGSENAGAEGLIWLDGSRSRGGDNMALCWWDLAQGAVKTQ